MFGFSLRHQLDVGADTGVNVVNRVDLELLEERSKKHPTGKFDTGELSQFLVVLGQHMNVVDGPGHSVLVLIVRDHLVILA